MKLIVISDIHGSKIWTKKIEVIIEKENPDKIIILGDLLYKSRIDIDYDLYAVTEILNKYKDRIICVRGNCDSLDDIKLMDFEIEDNKIIEYNGKKIYLTHGDRYNIDNIPYIDFDIMMYGHIHQGFIKKVENMLFINPGSISCPKGIAKNSYVLIENNIVFLKDFEDNIIQKYEMDNIDE